MKLLSFFDDDTPSIAYPNTVLINNPNNMNYTTQQIEEFKKKADKWDKLDEKLSSQYFDEDGEPIEGDGDLTVIGEIAAEAFGLLI